MTRRVTAGQLQLAISGCLLLTVAATFVGLDALACCEPLQQLLEERTYKICRQRQILYKYNGYFADFEDRLVLDELPNTDHSNGGVYLIGSSNLKWGTTLWTLPKSQRRFIHNYGIGGTNHSMHFDFLKHLIDHDGLISADGNKPLIVFAVSYHNVGPIYDSDGFFCKLWERHGYYTCSPESGIRPTGVSAFYRWQHTERIRVAGCLTKINYELYRRYKIWRYGSPTMEVRVHDRQYHVNLRRSFMGVDWQEKMRREVAQFDRLIEYLQSLGVQVAVVLMPQGSWEDDLPFERAYSDTISLVCRNNNVSVHDWTSMLDDDGFSDSSHLTLAGAETFQKEILKLVSPHLME